MESPAKVRLGASAGAVALCDDLDVPPSDGVAGLFQLFVCCPPQMQPPGQCENLIPAGQFADVIQRVHHPGVRAPGLEPRVVRRELFAGGNRARIKAGHCTACGKCEEVCRFDAILFDGPGNGVLEKTFRVDPVACEGCGVCAWFCTEGAIEFGPVVNGEWFISETRFGPMVHAKLGIAEENSGKLVSTVRSNARRIGEERELNLVLIDGSPGIGCPVIASITGANLVLVVTEPTLSGLHDLERVADLTRHFGIPALAKERRPRRRRLSLHGPRPARQDGARKVD